MSFYTNTTYDPDCCKLMLLCIRDQYLYLRKCSRLQLGSQFKLSVQTLFLPKNQKPTDKNIATAIGQFFNHPAVEFESRLVEETCPITEVKLRAVYAVINIAAFDLPVHEGLSWMELLPSQVQLAVTHKWLEPNVLLLFQAFAYKSLEVSDVQLSCKYWCQTYSVPATYNQLIKSATHFHKTTFEHCKLEQDPGVFANLQYEYYRLCWPQPGMNILLFSYFMTSLIFAGGHGRKIIELFSALNTSGTGMLTLAEILCGLCIMSPSAVHGGFLGQIRTHFIFRYFSLCKSVMTPELYECMLRDIAEKSPNSIAANQAPEVVNAVRNNPNFRESDLRTLISSSKLRGTSTLLRCRRPNYIHNYITDNEGGPSVISRAFSATPSINEQPYIGNDDDVIVLEPESAAPCESAAAAGPSSQRNGNAAVLKPTEKSITVQDDHVLQTDKHDSQKLQSEVMEKASRMAADSVKGVRLFAQQCIIGHNDGREFHKEAFSWKPWNMLNVAKCFEDMCAGVMCLLEAQPVCVQLQATSVLVMGNIHGHLAQLLSLERYLWPLGPNNTPSKLLFLGNYVDGGDYSFEVLLYVFSLKVQCADKVFLLRGNHECESVNHGLFKKGLKQRFGAIVGRRLWALSNKVFDRLPLAAVINDKVFCSNSGIPQTCNWQFCEGEGASIVSCVNALPPVQSADPQMHSLQPLGLAWDLMWNDALWLRSSALPKLVCDTNGFAPNEQRGTCRYFNRNALCSFLTLNRLTHMINAHGVFLNQMSLVDDKVCGDVRAEHIHHVLVEQDRIQLIHLNHYTSE